MAYPAFSKPSSRENRGPQTAHCRSPCKFREFWFRAACAARARNCTGLLTKPIRQYYLATNTHNCTLQLLFVSSGNGKFIFNNYTRNCNDLLKYLQRKKMCCDCTQTYETIANFSCVSCCPSLKFTLLPWVYKLYSRQFQCKTLSGLEMSSRTMRGFTELFVLGEHETKVRK